MRRQFILDGIELEILRRAFQIMRSSRVERSKSQKDIIHSAEDILYVPIN